MTYNLQYDLVLRGEELLCIERRNGSYVLISKQGLHLSDSYVVQLYKPFSLRDFLADQQRIDTFDITENN